MRDAQLGRTAQPRARHRNVFVLNVHRDRHRNIQEGTIALYAVEAVINHYRDQLRVCDVLVVRTAQLKVRNRNLCSSSVHRDRRRDIKEVTIDPRAAGAAINHYRDLPRA